MDNKQKFITNTLYIGLIGVIIYLGYKYLFPPLVPFIIAFLIAYFAIKLCNKFFKNDSKLNRSICLIAIYLVIIAICVFLTILGVNQLIDFFVSLPKMYTRYVEPALLAIEKMLSDMNGNISNDVVEVFSTSVDGIFDAIKSLVTSISTTLVSALTAIIANTPSALINIIVVIISSFYFCFDYQDIIVYIKRLLPMNIVDLAYDIKNFCENNLFGIIRTYIILMCITIIELFIGFLLFNIPNPGILALIISVVDILPILGIGTVLIPWGIIALIIGKTKIGIEILVLYLIMTFVRNILESRLVGDNLGLHPLATLVAMIIGLHLFGIFGMMLAPLVMSFIINRYNVES